MRKLQPWLIVGVVVGVLYWSALGTNFSLPSLRDGLPDIAAFLRKLFPTAERPWDTKFVPQIIEKLWETLRLALASSFLGAVLALPFTLVASRTLARPIVYKIGRGFLNILRSIPDLILATIFVAAFGIGPLPGFLALLFFSFGVVAKLLCDTVETIDPAPIEAIAAAGGTRLQQALYAVFPQILADFVAYTLYSFEINVRSAAILGFVGAGGIGFILQGQLGRMAYNHVGMIIVATFVVVFLIDAISTMVRQRLQSGARNAAQTTALKTEVLKRSLGFVLPLVVFFWSVSGIGIDPERLRSGFPNMGLLLKFMFFPPDATILPKTLIGLRESLQIAALGTFLAAIVALPFGVLAARNLARLPALPFLGKTILNAIRTFPELILAIAFLKSVGPGPFPGVLAMGVHSIGMMGKLYAERIENVDPGAIEALQATGASQLEIFRHGIIPEVLPDFLSFALYRFDLNVRSASVLGLVGAGGIGMLLNLQRTSGASAYPAIGTIVLCIVATVMLVDLGSAKLRAKLA
jgi:phosphonate ABC transporter permease subunit PhnE